MAHKDELINPFNYSDGDIELGLTKREYFAALNMAAIIGNAYLSTNHFNKEYMAEVATKGADALIEALNKPIS